VEAAFFDEGADDFKCFLVSHSFIVSYGSSAYKWRLFRNSTRLCGTDYLFEHVFETYILVIHMPLS
jgi:hypothetical protein